MSDVSREIRIKQVPGGYFIEHTHADSASAWEMTPRVAQSLDEVFEFAKQHFTTVVIPVKRKR